MNTARHGIASVGASNTAAIAVGGSGGPQLNEIWNGTNWTEVNDLNSARHTAAGSGTTTAGLVFGGDVPPATALTEKVPGLVKICVLNLFVPSSYSLMIPPVAVIPEGLNAAPALAVNNEVAPPPYPINPCHPISQLPPLL